MSTETPIPIPTPEPEVIANATVSVVGTVVKTLTEDLPLFAMYLVSDPLKALEMSHMVVLLFLLPALVLWVQGQLTSISKTKELDLNAPLEEDGPSSADIERMHSQAKTSPQNKAVWQIGVSGKAVAVSEEASLLGFNFARNEAAGHPAASEIADTIFLVMIKPFEGVPRRPSAIAFLPSRVCSDAVVQEVAKRITSILPDTRVTTMEEIEKDMPALMQTRNAEITSNPNLAAPSVVQQAQAQQAQLAAASGAKPVKQVLPMNPTPPRGCFVCKKDITEKTKQCSACKSVIYCSAECATKDWPNHKVMCSIYKANMQRLLDEDLNNFPFSFYKTDKRLDNYNQVPFLVQNDIHNVGVYRRLCQCFQQLQWGELSGELAAQMDADGVKDDEEKRFALSGLPKDLFPFGRQFKKGLDPETIDTWEAWYNAYNLSFSSPVALVFEVPLTVWFLIKKFAPKRIVNGRRQLTIHLLGPEREADLIHIFSYLLPLLPNTDIIIHMVGPTVSKRLRSEHTSYSFASGDSTLNVTLTSSEYTPVHFDSSYFGSVNKKTQGTSPPDLVLVLNGGVFQYQTFAPTIKLLMDKGARILFTEPIETSAIVMGKQFEGMKWNLTVPIAANPFRQPVFQWKKEVNLPGWSNGFYTGVIPQ